MKFEFCGHVNCPQWFIAEISVLTKITAIKLKLILSQIILHYIQSIDILSKTSKVSKLLNGTGLDIYQMHSVIATLKFNVSDAVLNKELIDLGLPKQNVQSITKTYKSCRDKLIEKSLQKVLKTTDDIQLHYSVHQFLASSKTGNFLFLTYSLGNLQDINLPPITFAQIELKYKDLINDCQERREQFIVTSQLLDCLVYQLESGLETMEKLEKADQGRGVNEELE